MKIFKFALILALSFVQITVVAQNQRIDSVKNVIIMIPDGANSALLTLARWYNDNAPLALDPYVCGMIRTHNSDGTFPDSAPAAAAYATGMKTKAPYIGINADAEPQVSVLELARRKGLATGLVATCEFPHATPANFVCHFNNREERKYKNLAKQFIYNSPDLLFAGGEKYIHDNNYTDLLQPNKIRLITDKKAFNNTKTLSDSSLWALFPDWQGSTRFMSYECDRDTTKAPSLSEMTAKAIKLLSQNKNGFFLMVEGSQIDWAAHANDPYAVVTEFVEFDKAVAEAIKFAKEDKNTVVIICPDHGTGGISIGNNLSSRTYSRTPVRAITDSLKKIQWSDRRLAEMKADSTRKSLKTYIGWTTTGHTAEDIFLAIYAPEHIQRLTGVVDNYKIGRYIAEVLRLEDFEKITKELYTKHTEYFDKKEIISLDTNSLHVKRNGKKLVFEANSNILKIKGEKEIRLPSIVVQINGVYYLPRLPL